MKRSGSAKTPKGKVKGYRVKAQGRVGQEAKGGRRRGWGGRVIKCRVLRQRLLGGAEMGEVRGHA